MSKLLIKVLIVLALLFVTYIGSAIAQAPVLNIEEMTVPQLIAHFSTQYNVSYIEVYKTIECETRFQNIQSQIFTNGHQEESYGIAQINIPWNPHITIEQAYTPSFAVDFMAKEFAKGNADRWTCWRTIYGNK